MGPLEITLHVVALQFFKELMQNVTAVLKFT